MSEKDKTKYVYNTTKIYKNNYPIVIDVDSICDELYNIAGDRESFENVMKRIENDILSSEVTKKTKNDEKYIKQNTYYSMNDIYNGNKFSFRTTLPEGELMKEPAYKSNILHKKYTDVNANSKYYYPQKDDNIMTEQINFRTQWTNRANKILFDNQNLMSSKTLKNTNQNTIF